MKDMSVEELEYGMKLIINSDAVDLIGKMAITNTWNELLRRFNELEKELESWRNSKDGIMAENEALAAAAIEKPPYKEDLKCCGNCVKIHKYECAKRTEEVLKKCTVYEYSHENSYCSSWQTDGLSREEREGK